MDDYCRDFKLLIIGRIIVFLSFERIIVCIELWNNNDERFDKL